MYGSSGVCRISEICAKQVGGSGVLYYVLKPVYDENSTIYCPVDSPKLKIRQLLSVNEIYRLIQEMPDAQTEWIDNEQQRKEKFSKISKLDELLETGMSVSSACFTNGSPLGAVPAH